MSQKQALFDEKAKSEAPYVCGNCKHAHFKLTPDEQAFLEEMLRRHGKKMQNWTKPVTIHSHGKSFFRQRILEQEKKWAAALIRKSSAYCKIGQAKVFWSEINCARYQPLAATEAEEPLGKLGPSP